MVTCKTSRAAGDTKADCEEQAFVPYYQIADTICSLYGDSYGNQKALALHIKQCLEARELDQLPDVISVVRSNACTLGRMVTGPTKQKVFPMGYGQVPIKKGCLIIIDMTDKLELKEATAKYTIDETDHTMPIVIRIIDAPAVKGALWTELQVGANRQKRIPTLIRRAMRLIQ